MTCTDGTVKEPAHDGGNTMSMATRTDTPSPAMHVAESHDLIRVQGACENNLNDVCVEIPKRRLTVFTGVSGSGKSSLVRHDRRGVAAADQRDLQRLRAGLHADPGAARG
jgi:excinuclease UvrABC ATPase subunit